MGDSIIKKLFNKFWPKKEDKPTPHGLTLPVSFFSNRSLPPDEILTTDNMVEHFRFTNTYYQNYGLNLETVAIGSKAGDIYFARVIPGDSSTGEPERYKGKFVLEKSTLPKFCEKLDDLLSSKWDHPEGYNYFMLGKDRILLSAKYPREVPMISFENHRSHSIDGEEYPVWSMKEYQSNRFTRVEARIILDILRKLIPPSEQLQQSNAMLGL